MRILSFHLVQLSVAFADVGISGTKTIFFRVKWAAKPSISDWTFNLVYVNESKLMSQDKELLKSIRCGDKDALRQIYEKYKEDLFTVAVSLLGDVHTSEDCLQDVFVAFADAHGRLNIRRNLKGYLISCVANRARDYQRKKTAGLDCPFEELSCLAISNDPAQKVIDSEQLCRILEALEQLPYQQREVFVLHVQGKMRFREIAEMLKTSIKTVQSRHSYAIEKLRALLEEKENAHEIK